LLLTLSLLLVPLAQSEPPATDKVELKKIKLTELDDAIAKHKGKFVIIDFWADYCVPCKAEFPNLVRLHRDHAKDGLVCMSVTVDLPEDAPKALKFLESKKATFENYIIDEKKQGETHEKWGFGAVPAVMIFGKDGKIAKKFTNDDPCNQFDYKDVDKYLAPLLKP
jgi:thiol-disulfide isomerase/thioredoxin